MTLFEYCTQLLVLHQLSYDINEVFCTILLMKSLMTFTAIQQKLGMFKDLLIITLF